MRGFLIKIAVVVGCVNSAPASIATGYQFVDLTAAGFTDSDAVTSSGSQQGGSGFKTSAGKYHALLWNGSAGSAVDLNPVGFNESYVWGSNGSVQVGSASSPTTVNGGHAMMWTGTAASFVDLHPAGYIESAANSAAANQQFGFALGGVNYHAMMWHGSAASAVDMNPPGFTTTFGNATSGARQVGDGFRPAFTGTRAVLWFGTATSAVDLTPAGFSDAWAYGVAGTEEVGFAAPTSGGSHAMLWNDTAASFVDLHPGGSVASSIALSTNGISQVGSTFTTGSPGFYHAMVWSGSAASALDLQQYVTGGFTNSYAEYIDGNGVIVGNAYVNSSNKHAVMWIPIPEPSAAVLSFIFFGIAVARRRGGRRNLR